MYPRNRFARWPVDSSPQRHRCQALPLRRPQWPPIQPPLTTRPALPVTRITNCRITILMSPSPKSTIAHCPATCATPIGQNEGIHTPNDLSQNYYSADASALSYDGKLFVFTGHDEASPDYGSFNMKDWGVYVTDEDGLNQGKWTHYKTIAKADLFSWATGDGAYAGQVVADDNGTPSDTSDDWFYYYVPVKDKASEAAGQDPFAIGVAKSKSPLGPWKDAIGKPLLTTSQTQIETIDPAYFLWTRMAPDICTSVRSALSSPSR